MKSFLLSCTSLLLCQNALAQGTSFTRYTIKDGLTVNRVNTITQSTNGTLWIGSFFGIDRFDGISIKPWPLKKVQQYVEELAVSGDTAFIGFLYPGTLEMVSKGGSQTIFKLPADLVLQNFYKLHHAPATGLTFGAGPHVYRYQHGSLQKIITLEPGSRIQSITCRGTNEILAATTSGLYKLGNRDGRWKIVKIYFDKRPTKNVYCSPGGDIWVTLPSDGNHAQEIWSCNRDSTGFKHLYTGKLKPSRFQSSHAEYYWAIEDSGMLFSLDAGGTRKLYPGIADPFAITPVIYADREHNIWLATDPGLVKFTPGNSKTFLFEEVPARESALVAWDSQLLTTSMYHLYKVAENGLVKVKDPADNLNYTIKPMAAAGRLFIARSSGGLWPVRHKNFTVGPLINDPLHPQAKFVAITSENKRIWMLTERSLLLYEGTEIKAAISLSSLLPTDAPGVAITWDARRKCLWIGTDGGGLYLVDVKSSTNIRVLHSFTSANGLVNAYIRSLHVDAESALWAGVRFHGALRLLESDGRWKVIFFKNVPAFNKERVIDMAEENGKSMFFATCNGVYRYHYKSDKWQHLGMPLGLPDAEVYAIGLDTLRKIIYASTVAGITEIHFEAPRKPMPPPPVYFTGVQVAGVTDSLALHNASIPAYPYNRNAISFSFMAPSFAEGSKVQYRYRLEGHEENWSAPSSSSQVTFASLPAGNYVFEVIATKGDGRWTETPARFQFEITRPFYLSTGFIILLLALTGALVYLLQYYHYRQKVKLHKMRLNIARDLHDDVGSALGSINILTRSARRKLEGVEAADEIKTAFEKIGSSAQGTLESMDDIIWAINPAKDDWKEVIVRMKEFGIPMAESNSIKPHFDIHLEHFRALPVAHRRNLFLLFKEAFTNAVKHAGCTNIIVRSKFKEGKFQLSVIDNGNGFNTSLPTGRNGIQNMGERASLMKGKLVVHADEKAGTTVSFECAIR